MSDIRPITGGMGGARIDVIDGALVRKRAVREELSESQWESCVREARFYERVSRDVLRCLPRVMDIRRGEDELEIWMPLYAKPGREAARAYANRMLGALAEIHEARPPSFLDDAPPGEGMTDTEIALSRESWLKLLSEFGDAFDASRIETIARRIQELERRFVSRERRLAHGDFHFDNALIDESGEIVICDWQNASVGDPAGDLSFFRSRLAADGCDISARELCAAYARERSGKCDVEKLLKSMALSNLIVSFKYWHMYLSGDFVRTRRVYDGMAGDLRALADGE